MNAVVARAPVAELLLPDLHAAAVPRSLSRIVVGLLFAQLWLSQSILSAAQIGVELLLALTLLVMLRKCHLQRRELALVILFCFSVAASLLVNPVPVTLVLAKVFGLSILSLLVFSRFRFDTTEAVWIIAINALLTLYQYAFGNPYWFLAIVLNFGETWREFAGSRPLGLFMSTHASAVLTALLFLWLGRRPMFATLGVVGLFVSGSTNILLAYVGQLMQRILEWLRIEKLAIGFAILVLIGGVMYAQTVLNLDLTTLSDVVSGREQVSYSIIINQLFSPDYYARAFTLIPGDPRVLYNEASGDWPNEIGYLSTLQQGGFLLGAGYTILLLTRIPGFRVFMAIGMLHFSMQTIPIVVFLLLQWAQPGRSGSQTALQVLFVPAREPQ